MINSIFDGNYTKIIYITNNNYSKNLTIDIIKKWKKLRKLNQIGFWKIIQ